MTTPKHLGWVGWLIATLCVAGLMVSSSIFLGVGASIDSGIALNIAFLAFPVVSAERGRR